MAIGDEGRAMAEHVTHGDTNRIALVGFGAVLFAILLVAFTNLVFAPPQLATPGYILPSGAEAAAPKTEEAPKEEPLPALLASADPKKGAQFAKVCTACHNFEKGAGAKVGPPLWGVVGRPIASVAGFSYSDSLKAVGGDWTFDRLNVMIRKPKEEATGTKMAFPGESDAHKRADILAFLQSLSDSPVPFPK
jgi:cytochrome c